MTAIVAAAAGCGIDDSSESSGTTRTDTATPSQEGTVWGRRDVPPAGVRRQIDFFSAGDSVCGPAKATTPTIMLDHRPFYQSQIVDGADDPELGETFSICAWGFDTKEPVRIELRRPDGSKLKRLLAAGQDQDRFTSFWLGAKWPVGQHQVTATQDTMSATLEVEIVLPRHRGARAPMFLGRDNPDPLPVMVVGQDTNSRVPVDIYRSHRSGYGYATSIIVETDKRGLGEKHLAVGERGGGRFVLRPRTARDPDDHDESAYVYICSRVSCQ